jgi:hypothetical protein
VRVAASNSVAAGLGLAGLTVGGAHSLYLISLVSGDAVNLGPIGAGLSTAGLALADSPNDFYLVDDPGDVVAETPSGGNDTAVTGLASYTLAANVENLIGTSATGQALTGNALNNAITGGMGGDSLGGGLGNDALTGGPGDDTFKFGPFGGMDAIADLAAGAGTVDRIDLRAMLQVHSLNDVLARATQVGADTVIDFGAGDALRLTGVNRASLSADDFMFSKATDLASGHDFGGGAADFLLQQESGGIRTLQITPVTGNVAQSPVIAARVGIDWDVDGAADFDRDGDSDILLHQDSGGVRNLLVYQMQGNAVQAANVLGQIGADLQNGGLGDFDGDADNDILLFRQVGDTKTLLTLEMEGGIVQGANNLGQVGADFQIDRIGDFDRDGDGDILLHQDAGGVRNLLILEMNGGAVVAGRSLGQVGLDVQVGGVGDFDRDGDGDVLLHQDVGGTRNLFVLEVEGNAVQAGQAIGQVGANVQIGGVGDFDQDGDADISLQSVTGASTQLFVLAMEDNAIAAANNAASLGLDLLLV